MNWKHRTLHTSIFAAAVLAANAQGQAGSLESPAAKANAAATPAVANFSPGPEYADGARMFQGIPGIERAANGRLWATWYGGGVGEDKQNYIMLYTSGDGGKSWQRVLVLDPDGDGPVRPFDPCLWHDPEGRLWLFWAQEIAGDKARVSQSFAITTADSSKGDAEWSAPRRICKGVMMNKPIVAADGRWLLPMATWFAEGSARVVASSDRGATFSELGAANIPDAKMRNADEHMIVQRRDGALWLLVRTKYGIGESVSTDGGRTWPDVTPAAIPHPVTRFFIRRLASGRLLLVRHNPPNGKSRSHLIASLSDDDGRTWEGGLMLDERGGVSYPDGVQSPDGSIDVIYDFNRWGDKEILMASFTESDVLEGKPASPASRLRVRINQATGVKPAKPAAATAQNWPLDAVVPSLKVHGRVTGAKGAQGRSLALDGGSLIELGDTGPLNGGAEGFTFSVWFNPYDLHRGQQVIAAKNRYSSGERQWSVALEADGTLRAYLHQEKWKTIPTTAEIKPGRWHLVTLTVSPSKAALYLNGRRAGEAALARPIPPTAAPITLGGVNDKGQLRQQLLGAVDAARFEPRVLGADEIAASYHPVSVTHELPKPLPAGLPVWPSDRPVPRVAELSALSGMEFHVIKRHEPEVDGYPWLHGVGLAWHKGKLYASFGHNKGAENTASEEARGRVSGDGGKTWGDVFTIDTGTDAADLAISHGVFLSQGGTLWAFHGAFHGRMGNIHTRAYTLDEGTGRWQPRGIVIEGGFWPLNQPVKMTDGNWIMPGIRAKLFSDQDTNPAAVAISHGDDLLKWDMVALPAPAGIKMWGESAILVDGPRVLNIARYGAKPLALAALSEDHGRTWTESLPSNLPMATSKPCAGVLGNGQRYLICTTTADSAGRRAPLTIAVSRSGESMFRKVFLIRAAVFPAGPGESHERAALSYPCATEHEGRLYVGYSNSGGRGGNNNSAEMAVIPIDHLRVE